ncbi:hypothetical protein SLE2022_346700 [Rubroshorea leprosula]
MGVFTYETKIVTTIPLAKMFTAFVLDGDNLIPKVVPQAVKSVEIIEGDGGPGSIKKITFGEVHQFKYVKHKMEVPFARTPTSISLLVRLRSRKRKSRLVKKRLWFYQKKKKKEKALGLFRVVEAYLLANPNTY